MAETASDTYRHLLDLLREGDRERYLALLFAPEDKRPALAALHAFNLEVARVPHLVSEPMPGEIRLQWWRDVLSGEREAEGRQHPVAAALLNAIRDYNLPLVGFANLLEARVFDLYADPMPSRTDLEGYLGETASVLFQMSARVLADGDDPDCADASGHAGVAYGISGLLRLAPLHRHRSQVYMPADMLQAAGSDAAAWLKGDDTAALGRVLAAMTALGREHLSRAEAALAGADRRLKPAFLPLAVAEPVFRRADKAGAGAAERPVELSPLATQWHILKRALMR